MYGRSAAKRKGRGWTRSLFVALSLAALLNLAFAPVLRAAAPASVGEVAADLQSAFGSAFRLCVNVDDSAPVAPHHGEEGCALCCAHGAASAVPPEPSPLAAPVAMAASEPLPPDERAIRPPARASPAQPRAPPRI